ncbi:alpha/beta fold hydrolase, partial [Saccharomonospora saliphila]|uniref:alpha/beta fold hydrolase n=1 Tax=Saccharomonospora saliphila TaxID=369829 RepID=UPI00048EBE57
QTAISGHERRAALARLRDVPGVVCVGTADRLCPPRHARVIADEWQSGRLVLYPGAGHMLPQERAHDIALHLTDLLTPALRPAPAH